MIDWDHIAQLELDIGTSDFKNLVTLFLEEVAAEIDRLKEPFPTEELGRSMHFLAGSARYMGFRAFGNLCTKNEELANSGNAKAVDLEELVSVYEQCRDQFFREAADHCSFEPDP